MKVASGCLKRAPSDFVVEEILGFDFSGSGEHVVLQIRKQDMNTLDVVDAISRVCGVARRHVGFGGLKDKHALTTQWFSVLLPPGKHPNWGKLENERIEILRVDRTIRKLKRGSHRGNRFKIAVRDVSGNLDALRNGLSNIEGVGVPNYFGPQRFGYSNLEKADAMFSGSLRVSRAGKGILLSAARSSIFNEVLARRDAAGTWNKLLPGDVASLDGSNSFFTVDEPTAELQGRLDRFDIHPSGPLYGIGDNPAAAEVGRLESEVFQKYQHRCQGLSNFGLRLQRRALRLKVADFRWELSIDGTLTLSFLLGKGGYATAVVDHLLDVSEH